MILLDICFETQFDIVYDGVTSWLLAVTANFSAV